MIERVGFGAAPVLSDWTDSFMRAYEPRPGAEDYDAYVQRMREIDPRTAPMDSAIERAINLGVEGHAEGALETLLTLEPRVEPRRRVAYHRLMGALLRELGATDAARESYTKGLNLLDARDPARIYLEWDELGLRGDRDAHRRYEELLNAPVPITPAYEYARTRSAKEFAKELFEEEHRSEGTMRWRSGMPSEVAWHNTALAVAYLTGDFEAARAARASFGRLAAGGASDSGVELATAARELLLARDSKALKLLLDSRGYLVHGSLEVDALAITLRPREPRGEAAEPVWQTLLAILTTMSPYLKAETRRRLTSEMTDAAVRHLSGEGEQFVSHSSSQGGRAPSSFAEALSEIAQFELEDLHRFADALIKRDDIFTPWTGFFWRPLMAHAWRPEDESVAAAIVKKVTSSTLPKEAMWEVFQVLRSLGRTFAHLEPESDEWVIARSIDVQRRLEFFGDREHAAARPHMDRWVEEFVSRVVRKLETTKAGDPVAFPVTNPGRILESITRAYRVNDKVVSRWATRLVGSTSNPDIHVEQKAAIFDAVARLARAGIGDIAETLKERRPPAERSRTFGDSPPEVLAQLRLLELRSACGLESSEADEALLRDAFFNADYRVRSVAAVVAGEVVGRGRDADVWASLIMHLLTDRSYVVRAASASAAIRSGAVFRAELGATPFRLISALLSGDNPYVTQVVLYALADRETRIPPARIPEVSTLADLALASSHSGIRRAGEAVVGRAR